MSERQDEPESSAGEAGNPGGQPGTSAPVPEETASLLSLIDRLGSLLEKSDLVEIEVEAGETGIILRKPAALVPAVVASAAGAPGAPVSEAAAAAASAAAAELAAPPSTVKTIRAPLTGVFYSASSPSAPPFVTIGQQIEVGHVIGLIEAMKLFNEIKSDQAGRVVRIVAETGKLVKAKQPLIEVEPA
jgi:acetyl-CoA carboxylase biotin carboxyl carrier protein